MMRVLCLWLPNWPIQRVWIEQPERRRRPLILFAEAPRGQQLVVACCPIARECGIRPGLSLAEAQTLGQDARGRDLAASVIAHEPAADWTMLRRLAWDCEGSAPIVGLETTEHPECLLLDITGCGPVFGGEENLARQLRQRMQQRGLLAQVGVADSVGMAWAVAHSRRASRKPVSVSPENQPAILRRLPVELLRLSEGVLTKLRSLNLRTVGQLLALPRESLPSRFGGELLQRLDQLFGRRPETIVPERRPEPVEAFWESEAPLTSEAGVETIAGELLRTIRDRLKQQGTAFQKITCRFSDASGKTARLSLELLRPTTDVDHVLELLRLQWQRLTFGDGLIRIEVRSIRAMPIPVQQQSLLDVDTRCDSQRHLELLIERLSSRLGPQAVLHPQLAAEAIPERAYGFVSCLETPAATDPGDQEPQPVRCLRRPLWLQESPIPVEVLSVVPAGPPYQFRWRNETHPIAQAWGPERITAGWWSGQHVRRDYYQVETDGGCRFWLFRDLGHRSWFLHATFD